MMIDILDIDKENRQRRRRFLKAYAVVLAASYDIGIVMDNETKFIPIPDFYWVEYLDLCLEYHLS